MSPEGAARYGLGQKASVARTSQTAPSVTTFPVDGVRINYRAGDRLGANIQPRPLHGVGHAVNSPLEKPGKLVLRGAV